VPGIVLNNAIKQSGSEIIVLLNADAIPRSDTWLETLIHPIINEQAAATFSRQVPRPDARFIVAYDYTRAFNPEKMQAGFFSAVACAFRRSLWQKHRFPEDGYAEDTRWAQTVLADGAPVRFVNDSVVEHSHNYSLASLYRKRFRQAQAFGRQTPFVSRIMLCLREIVRDLMHAAASRKIQTIPYNIAYRITIHRAMHNGSKAA